MAEQRRIVLDVDTGIDDAMAILYALSRPDIQLEAVTTVFGNVDVATATRNTLQVLELARRSDVPVAAGCARALGRPYTDNAARIHGGNGLGNVTLPAPNAKPIEQHAVPFLMALARANPGAITLIPVGPLTNLATLFLQAPDTAPLFREIVIMGGAVDHPGNVTATAEANIWNDPEAARIVFQSGARIKLVGLDVTMKTLFSTAMLEHVAANGSPAGKALMAMTRYYVGAYEAFYPGIGGCALHDPLAVAVAEDPSLVRTEAMFVDVECTGELTRGQTVADRRGTAGGPAPNMEVCLDVDAHRFTQRFVEALLDGGKSA